jgi:hypothetical protein
MAEVKANIVTKGMSGMIGKTLVFRQNSITGTRISVKTYDMPGNLSEKEETLA